MLTVYRENWGELCRRLNRLYGPGPPDPEDIAQEAFARLWRLDTIEHIENLRAFLFRTAINLALKSKRRIVLNRRYIAEKLGEDDAGVEQINPERVLSGRQRIHAVDRGIRNLTEKQREILLRSRIKGQTYAEISKETGWSHADISRQLNAALVQLKAADARACAASDDSGESD